MDTKDAYSIGDGTSTRYNGRVWVDKSVSSEASVDFEDAGQVTNNSDFLVTYSALATSTNTVGLTPTDTVFILDLSASMTWGFSGTKSVTDEHGGLSVSADVQNKDIVFTNEYMPGEVTVGPGGDVQIGGTKTLEVADGSQREMKEGEFTFLLLEEDQEVDRVTNAADGTFAFKDITYDKAGTHYYTVSEINNGAGGIDYDPTLYSVVVEVTENTETHELEAEVTYYNTADTETSVAGMTFTNSYEASPVSANLGIVKKLDGADLKEGQFTFTLSGSSGAPMPEKDTVTNAADGSVLFDTITFDSVGEYDYTITEVTYGEDGAVITNTAEVTPPSDDNNGGKDDGKNDVVSSSDPGNTSDGHENVQTGDTAQFIPVVAALLASLLAVIAIAVIMIRRRRR